MWTWVEAMISCQTQTVVTKLGQQVDLEALNQCGH